MVVVLLLLHFIYVFIYIHVPFYCKSTQTEPWGKTFTTFQSILWIHSLFAFSDFIAFWFLFTFYWLMFHHFPHESFLILTLPGHVQEAYRLMFVTTWTAVILQIHIGFHKWSYLSTQTVANNTSSVGFIKTLLVEPYCWMKYCWFYCLYNGQKIHLIWTLRHWPNL